jgi:Zn-finger nucleic acid-binding protein
LHARPGDASLVCPYCHSVHIPDADYEGIRILEEQSDLLCPVCQATLSHASLAGKAIEFCGKCRGMLFPLDHLQGMIESVSLDGAISEDFVPDRSELDRKLACPSCHRPMETHPYYGGGHIVIDDCENCSLIWLDHGELKRMALAIGTDR